MYMRVYVWFWKNIWVWCLHPISFDELWHRVLGVRSVLDFVSMLIWYNLFASVLYSPGCFIKLVHTLLQILTKRNLVPNSSRGQTSKISVTGANEGVWSLTTLLKTGGEDPFPALLGSVGYMQSWLRLHHSNFCPLIFISFSSLLSV